MDGVPTEFVVLLKGRVCVHYFFYRKYLLANLFIFRNSQNIFSKFLKKKIIIIFRKFLESKRKKESKKAIKGVANGNPSLCICVLIISISLPFLFSFQFSAQPERR